MVTQQMSVDVNVAIQMDDLVGRAVRNNVISLMPTERVDLNSLDFDRSCHLNEAFLGASVCFLGCEGVQHVPSAGMFARYLTF